MGSGRDLAVGTGATVIGGACLEYGPDAANAAADGASSCCFPPCALVNVTGKGAVPMAKLQIGDEVETMTVSGYLTHGCVDFFLHKEPEKVAEFLGLSTDDGRKLLLTPDHQLGVDNGRGRVTFMFAADVTEGMNLLVPKTDFPQWVKVTSIGRETLTGIYAPCTAEGTIVVSGLGCSCYAVCQHEDVHQSLALLYRAMSQFPHTATRACHAALNRLGARGVRNMVSLGTRVSALWSACKLVLHATIGNRHGDASCLKPTSSTVPLINSPHRTIY